MAKNTTATIIRHSLRGVSLLLLTLFMAACSKNSTEPTTPIEPADNSFSLTEEVIFVDPDASSVDIGVTAGDNTSWTLDEPLQEWLTAKSSTNKGDGVITISFTANINNQPRQCYVLVRCNNDKHYIEVNQKKGVNVAPDKPEYIYPEPGADNINPYAVLKWKKASDPNNDKVSYKISYSQDQENWTTTENFDKLSYNDQSNEFDHLSYYISEENKKLSPNSTYYWYVTSVDPGGLETKGDVQSFTTGNPVIPSNGSYTVYKGSENGIIPLVFTGDGFIPSDYVEGGDFDKKIDEGIEHFFSCEPYKSYRNLFKVYKLVAYSNEQGISIHDTDADFPHIVDIDTRFNVRYKGNGYNNTQMTFESTGNRSGIDAAFDFVKNSMPGIITYKVLTTTTVIVVANYWLYGGTCWWSYTDSEGKSDWNGYEYTGNDGTSIAIVPVCEQGRNIPWMDPSGNHHVYYSYEATMRHEGGGHGFARLADEYKYGWYPAGTSEINSINTGTQHGYNGNIDVTDNPAAVKWNIFFSTDEIIQKYPQVGVYEGAQYTKNVYMSENSENCMGTMSAPYNAVSRNVIVQKIYKALGGGYSFEKFMENDRTDPMPANAGPNASYADLNIHHTPPQIVKSK